MRPIKFRGRVTANFEHGMHKGKLICGTLQDHSAVHIKREDWNSGYWIYPGGKNGSYPIEPESIAQLVGFDRDGAEVYEGDVLIDELEQEYTAEIYDRPEKIHALKLKEEPST